MRKRHRAYLKILRNKAERERKRMEEKQACTPDKVFCYGNIIRSAKKCTKGVSWKASVQAYHLRAISKTYTDYRLLKDGKVPRCMTRKEIAITERGKIRVITPIHIKDRVIQKTICDNALVPVLRKKLIYDNGASLKGKGVSFSRRRLENHLKKAVRKFGQDFYILTYDIKNFFGSIPHKQCRKALERYFPAELANIAMEIIKNPVREKIRQIKDSGEMEKQLRELEEDKIKGICLGSQESQIMALAVPSCIDHYIKDRRRMKFYIRYMDDGVLIAKTKEELKKIFAELKAIMESLGMKFNERKTRITKAKKGFTFLKVKYHISKTGKIIRRLTPKGTARMRRKLKKFRRKVDAGEMTLTNVYESIQSWMSHSKVANSHKTVRNMLRLYRNLFGDLRIPPREARTMEGKHGIQAGY